MGTNYWLRSREQAVELSPPKVAELSDLPSFVQVRGKAEGGVETTTDNNVLFRVAGYPSVVFSAGGANDRERTIALLNGTEFDGRMYTAKEYSSMAVNQFAERARMSDARVVRVGETPTPQDPGETDGSHRFATANSSLGDAVPVLQPHIAKPPRISMRGRTMLTPGSSAHWWRPARSMGADVRL
ncbi:hypothetical protein WMF20_12855 [Sorangium sp. So ce834]|uniref:hypothetical protein n=1 Tax=Sorangium sp. So ce834 TaxID=3133321 RepID=UPI003F5D7359